MLLKVEGSTSHMIEKCSWKNQLYFQYPCHIRQCQRIFAFNEIVFSFLKRMNESPSHWEKEQEKDVWQI